MAQSIIGTVVSTKMQKTIVVRIERKFRHHLYRKVITRHKKFKAHCEDSTVAEGDTVLITETKPLSKDKHFMFVKKVSSATQSVQEVKEPKETKSAEVKKTRSTVKKKSKSK